MSTKSAPPQLDGSHPAVVAVHAIHRLIRRATNRDSLLEEVCGCFTTSWGFASAWIVMLSGDSTPTAVYGSGLGDSLATLEQPLRDGILPQCALEVASRPDTTPIVHNASECQDCPLSAANNDRYAVVIGLRADSADERSRRVCGTP